MSEHGPKKDGAPGHDGAADREEDAPPETPAWLRRLVTGVSAVVVVGVVAALLALDPPGAPERPRIGARVLEAGVERLADRWIVPYEVVNQGTRPVARVRVVVTLEGGGAAPEVDQEFDHLPRGRRVEGVAVFHGDALRGTPKAEVEAYVLP